MPQFFKDCITNDQLAAVLMERPAGTPVQFLTEGSPLERAWIDLDCPDSPFQEIAICVGGPGERGVEVVGCGRSRGTCPTCGR